MFLYLIKESVGRRCLAYNITYLFRDSRYSVVGNVLELEAARVVPYSQINIELYHLYQEVLATSHRRVSSKSVGPSDSIFVNIMLHLFEFWSRLPSQMP